MNILMLTPIYPANDVSDEATPVVHYFTREWVRLGHVVKVVYYPSNFPKWMYTIARPIKRLLEAKLGVQIRTFMLKESRYCIDGVFVYRIPLKKYKPHGRYNSNQIELASCKTIDWCISENFIPDVIIGHWINPQIEIIEKLKQRFNVPACLVLHDAGNDLSTIYKSECKELLANVDILGFRSLQIKKQFEKQFKYNGNHILCYSGVPKSFVESPIHIRQFNKVRNFVFVGMLIERKYPHIILEALKKSEIKDYTMTYIGEGLYRTKIADSLKSCSEIETKVKFTGRIPREKIKRYLQDSDVFVMISSSETFGLVYLEAMAAGCITIASKNEGFDGIIQDGYNGFLCEAGNVDELTLIINKINNMSAEDLQAISINARNTAVNMTDQKVAEKYINSIIDII